MQMPLHISPSLPSHGASQPIDIVAWGLTEFLQKHCEFTFANDQRFAAEEQTIMPWDALRYGDIFHSQCSIEKIRIWDAKLGANLVCHVSNFTG
jgi:hypothetical protein